MEAARLAWTRRITYYTSCGCALKGKYGDGVSHDSDIQSEFELLMPLMPTLTSLTNTKKPLRVKLQEPSKWLADVGGEIEGVVSRLRFGYYSQARTLVRSYRFSYTEVAELSATPRWLCTQLDRDQRGFLVYINV